MSNLAYYLKYRPQNLDQIIGQEAVKKTLLSSFQNQKLAHAYLLVGPRGTGKTSTARILAKMINCENQPSVISYQPSDKTSLKAERSDIKIGPILKTESSFPCNQCPTCVSITDGSNMDLIEIDAASNRGIEDIRSLRDKIKLSPTSARKKVYIIDEAHMLTAEAFNALLKTLEEPPDHALFILATTEGGKIPATILSRVSRLDFKLAGETELMEALRRIVKDEKLDIEEEALGTLAKKSDGSFRDAVKLLDQASSMGGKITVKLIMDNLRISRFEDILELIHSLKDKNTGAGLITVSRQMEQGTQSGELIMSLMDFFRSLALIKNGVGAELVKISMTEDKYQTLVTLSESFTNEELVKDLDILQKAWEKLKFASIPALPLELAIVDICTSFSVITSEQSERGDLTEKKIARLAESAKWATSPAERGPRNDNLESIMEPKILKPIRQAQGGQVQDDKLIDNNSSPDIAKLKEKWTFVLETIRSSNFSLEALLRSISIKECSKDTLVVEVPYSFHQRILEVPKNKNLLEGVFSDILGRTIKISTVLGSRPVRGEDIANIEVAQDDEIIRAAAEIFNSDLVN